MTNRYQDEAGWLIEAADSPAASPLYLAGYGDGRPGAFSHDPAEAIRFARKIDAERAWTVLDDGENKVRICEHIWGSEQHG